MMHFFTFDGKDSRNFKVMISGEDTWKKPNPILERTTVPGRNGELITFNGAYENASVSYHCGVIRDFDESYTAFINFLMSNPGYRRLEDSYHPGYYRMATVESVGDPSLTKLNRSATFDVSFTCKPQTFLKSGEKKLIYTSNGTLFNPTLFDAKPLLRVYGKGEFSIGSGIVTITATNGYTDLDCELEDAYKDDSSVNCNANIRLAGDHFPVIPAGRHGVTLGSGITRIEIIPRWWQL